MRKSQFGEEIIYLWEGCSPLEDIVLVESGRIFEPPDFYKQKIEEFRQQELAKDPAWHDGFKVRYENHQQKLGKLIVNLGMTRYSQDRIMREVAGNPINWYPNPLSTDALQETDDGFFALGVRGRKTDFAGIVDVLGAGTIDKDKTVAETVEKECKGETVYSSKHSYDIHKAVAMALIYGTRPQRNTTVGVRVPLEVASKEIDVNKKEHSELVLVPNSERIVEGILQTGYIALSKNLLAEGRAVAQPLEKGDSVKLLVYDHTLGLFQRYLELRNAGLIKSPYVHS
jgi:hypothetical protein